MKRLLPFLLLFVPAVLFAQIDEPVTIEVNSTAVGASNSLPYSAINKYFRGGKISAAEKEKWSSRIKAKNMAFADASVGIGAVWLLKRKKEFGIGVVYKARFFAETRFSKELWNTILYGNKQYGTEKVDLGSNNIEYSAYRDLALKFVTPKWDLDEQSKMWLDFNGGFRIGIAQLGFSVKDFTIHNTTELSENLDVQADFDLKNAGSRYLNGLGGAFDVGVNFEGGFADRNLWTLNIGTANLGFTYWDSKSYSLSRKLDFSFDGFETNIAQLSNSIKGSIDTMVRFVTDSARRGIYATVTPASIYAFSSVTFKNYAPVILGIEGGLSFSLFSNFIFIASVAPSVAKEWEDSHGAHSFKFKLPIKYCNYSGIGLGGGIAYKCQIPNDDMTIGVNIEGGVLGFRSAAAYGALTLSFFIL